MRRYPAIFLLLAACLTLAALAVPARAADDCRSMTVETQPYPGSARVTQVTVEGKLVEVLLPPGYTDGTKRYPVLYLLHGFTMNQDSWLVYSDVESFTAGLPASQQAIVVMPAMNGFGFDVDHRNGTQLFETFVIDKLIPYIDGHFRTLADRAHRAIAGLSAASSVILAGRNPDKFVAMGSFSSTQDAPEAVIWGVDRYIWLCFGGSPADEGVIGRDPIRDPLWYHAHNPTDLAENYGGMAVYFRTGTGVPCDQEDVDTLLHPPTKPATGWQPFETVLRPGAESFDKALTQAGVAHTAELPACGIHSWRYFQLGLHRFWPIMSAAFGSRPPATFDYKTADTPENRRTSDGVQLHSTHAMWGWTFLADPARAPEFLGAHDVSCHGLTLTGSGSTTVTTARCFTPGSEVQVSTDGGGPRTLTADRSGRVSIDVDLGAPHPDEQFTVPARVKEASGPYWATRTINLRQATRARRAPTLGTAPREAHVAAVRATRPSAQDRRGTLPSTGAKRAALISSLLLGALSALVFGFASRAAAPRFHAWRPQSESRR